VHHTFVRWQRLGLCLAAVVGVAITATTLTAAAATNRPGDEPRYRPQWHTTTTTAPATTTSAAPTTTSSTTTSSVPKTTAPPATRSPASVATAPASSAPPASNVAAEQAGPPGETLPRTGSGPNVAWALVGSAMLAFGGALLLVTRKPSNG
jgi:LPXTG-motif cell wall-anchored protein